jgi:monoamine oxidase
MTELTRRGLIGTAAGAAVLGAGTPAEAAQRKRKRRPRRRSRKADFVVVGAGFAGLTAAREIVKAGRSVLVVEARNRVGGRVLNHHLPGGEVSEAGGTFVGPTQDHIINLAKAYGIDTFPTFADGENVSVIEGERSTYSDTGPTGTAPPDPLILPELAAVVTQMNELSKEVPVDAPWTAARAGEWDGQTLETYIAENSRSARFRSLIPVATRPIFGAEPRELSLLFVLFYIAASGNETTPGTFDRNFNTREGAQMFRFVGGSGLIGERIVAELGAKRFLLKQPVRRIVQTATGVRVETSKTVVHGQRVIVAVPPALAARIDYKPLLPMQRDQLMQRLGQGTLTKVAAVYDRPFWRDKGLNGTALSTRGLVNATFDDSPPDGSPGVIFGFVGGDQARIYETLTPAERRERVLAQFAEFFGEEARGAVDFFDTRWPAEKWSRGGPVGIYGPGTLLAGGPALRAPVGRIHWAGTETSTFWNGYMDGAVRSGERAAKEVLEA